MRHSCLTCDAPDLPGNAFRKSPGLNRPATLEGGKGGSAPSYPDPNVVAGAQTTSNENTAAYNKALGATNYSNPFGSQQTTQIGTDPTTGAPIYGSNTTASPGLQSMLTGLEGQAGYSGTLNQDAITGLGQVGQQYGNLNQGLYGLGQQSAALGSTLNPQAAQQAQQQGMNAAYQSSMGYLQPQFNQQQESTAAQLANQGLSAGSQAWNNAETNLSQNQGMQQQQALNNAQITGSQIGTQNYQNQLAGLGAQSSLIGQQAGLYGQAGSNLGQQAGLYGQTASIGQLPYNDLSSIAQMIPGYTGTGSAAANSTDVSSLYNNQYQSQLAGYNANQASNNATMGAVGSVAGMAAMAFF